MKMLYSYFRCSARDESDFRPLFENFLHDLFITSNLPEWPAAEVLLTQLGRLFVVTFSNSKLDMMLRSSALDYLSQIATHLRKGAMRSEGEQEKLKLVVEKVSVYHNFLFHRHEKWIRELNLVCVNLSDILDNNVFSKLNSRHYYLFSQTTYNSVFTIGTDYM